MSLMFISSIIGWCYFAVWSVSFYPQIYSNWRRKSVVGLNFDFLAYNITGFVAYGLFNVGMYFVPLIKDQYQAGHPSGINPVQLNDVVFALHAAFITVVTILQCFIYERGDQRLSCVCMMLVAGTWVFCIFELPFAMSGGIPWLHYLYQFSYIKLVVTLIKYNPQAYMNYCRKSTDGWNIGNVLLDFTGGCLSMLQMLLLAYASGDWMSIYGNPTKFGLGIVTILYDILFMVQHYCLYPKKDVPYQQLVLKSAIARR